MKTFQFSSIPNPGYINTLPNLPKLVILNSKLASGPSKGFYQSVAMGRKDLKRSYHALDWRTRFQRVGLHALKEVHLLIQSCL